MSARLRRDLRAGIQQCTGDVEGFGEIGDESSLEERVFVSKRGRTECHELQNYGKIFTGKLSPKVLMALFTAIPKELGFIGTPKFLTKIQGKERHWKGRLAEIGEPRGITHEEFFEGFEYVLASYTAIVATCGDNKGDDAYTKLTAKIAGPSYAEFFPSAKDFRKCPDHWEAVREYFLEFLRAYDRENIMRFKVVQSTDGEFHARLSECIIQDMFGEVGYRHVAFISCDALRIFIADLCRDLGGDFKRECHICKGDAECDWHFYRQKVSA